MDYPRSILAVCRANERRSITAELIICEILIKKGYKISNIPRDNQIYIDSAGVQTNPQKYNVKQMTIELGNLAEKIFTFNRNLETILIVEYNQDPKKIINLEVADRFPCGHPLLIEELKKKINPYIEDWYP